MRYRLANSIAVAIFNSKRALYVQCCSISAIFQDYQLMDQAQIKMRRKVRKMHKGRQMGLCINTARDNMASSSA